VTESDGVRRRRWVYGSSRAEATAALAQLQRKNEASVPIPPSHLTLGRYLDEWLTQIVAPRVRPNTLAGYRFHIDRYLKPDLGKKRMGALSARELRFYLERLKQRGIGVRTIRYVHATLRAALEDAVREELIEKNVAKLVRPPATPRSEREPLTIDEIRTFLEANKEDRLYALFVVIALLGLCRSEALGLQWQDVDLDRGTLSVRRGLHRIDGRLVSMETRTRRSQRTIPLPPLVTRALVAHRAAQVLERRELAGADVDSGHVFSTTLGTPLDPDNTTKAVNRALKHAGVRDVRLHDFRHGCVSVLMGLGVPPRIVMEIAGHSALEMTMNVYAHVSLDDKQAALDRLGALFDIQE
jgi:integrase